MSLLSCRKRPASAVIDIEDNEESLVFAIPKETCGPVPYQCFLKMWSSVEQDDGWDASQFEDTHAFKRANHNTDTNDTSDGNQKKAQYGRLSFPATRVLFEKILQLQWFHVFVDIGHGIGNTVLQAAYTVGCESLGIELVGFRHDRALVYQEKLEEVNRLHNQLRDDKHYAIGKVRMRHGSLHAPEHLQFLTVDTDKAFCNNFGNVFGHRCVSKPEQATMDHYLAALFALMKPGAVLTTLHPLPLLPCVEEANAIRKRLNLPTSEEASFYHVEEYELLGKGLVSWTDKSIVVYKYTRTSSTESTFLCCNPQCEKAQTMQAISAVRKEGDVVLLNYCDCRVAERSTRGSSMYQCRRTQMQVEEDEEEDDE